jgi:hypothetical protein
LPRSSRCDRLWINAKQQVKTTSCLNNQRQTYLALAQYGSDFEEYPSNYSPGMAPSWNWGDECSGRWVGNPPTRTSWVYNTAPFFYPAQGTAAIYHLLNDNYAERSTVACAISLKGEKRHNKGGWYFTGRPWDNYQTGVYIYNGPHTPGSGIRNNAAMSGLVTMARTAGGGATQSGLNWGIRFRRDIVQRPGTSYSVADVAFFTCPSIYRQDGLYRETHDYTGTAEAWPGGNGQFDRNNMGWFARNYCYGDGHADRVYTRSRIGYEP